MTKDNLFSVVIVWGSEDVKEENPVPVKYEFETEAELTAFMQGVDAAIGWLDYEVIE